MSSDYKIMVVDDEHDILYMIVRYLKVWKFQVEGFTDPRKALESFESDPKGYSLVLTDVRMRGISGIELAKKILAIKPDTKVILMTAYEVTAEMMSGLPTIRRSEVLKKPFRLAEVCESLKRQLRIQV